MSLINNWSRLFPGALLGLSVLLVFPADIRADDTDPPMQVVEKVDLSRYIGTWYEIAKIPNRFQKQCVRGTTAQYTLREDGKITVLNSCFKANGKLDDAEGLAKVVDTATGAKLEVSFVSFLGWRPFWGDYWVIGLDQEYQWAVIGTPNRKYGWVLARAASLGATTLEEIWEILRSNGYDTQDFVMSPQ